jgi:hypothetical protein
MQRHQQLLGLQMLVLGQGRMSIQQHQQMSRWNIRRAVGCMSAAMMHS